MAPVDVEIVAIAAGLPPFDDAAPPGVLKACCHVVGHDVEDEPQTFRLQGP